MNWFYPNAFCGFQGDVIFMHPLESISDILQSISAAFMNASGGTLVIMNTVYDYAIENNLLIEKDGEYYYPFTPMKVTNIEHYYIEQASEIIIPKNMHLPRIEVPNTEIYPELVGIYGDWDQFVVQVGNLGSILHGMVIASRSNDNFYRKIIFTKESSMIINENDTITQLTIDQENSGYLVFFPYIPSIVVQLIGFGGFVGEMDLRDCNITVENVDFFFNITRSTEPGSDGITSCGSFIPNTAGTLVLTDDQINILEQKGLIVTNSAISGGYVFFNSSFLIIREQEKEVESS